jgi:paraquat-inducible protein B
MSLWDRLFPTRQIVSEVRTLVRGNTKMVAEIRGRIDSMGATMADVSDVLNGVAEGLRDRLGPAIRDVLAENAQLRNRNAELEGEDVAESAAASNVKSAFDDVARQFDGTDEAPTPDPLPEPEQPGPEEPQV